MRLAAFLTVIFLLQSSISIAQDGFIVVDQRYITPRAALASFVFKNEGEPITFAIGVTGFGHRAEIKCDDLWDWSRVKTFSLDFAKEISEAKSLDLFVFVSKYFSNCTYANKFNLRN